MKKFIEALKEAGIYDQIVEVIVDVRSKYGAYDATKAITTILKIEMVRNSKLIEVFRDDVVDLGFKTVGAEIMKSVVDVEKVDAIKDVNPDELFKKATENGDSELNKSNEEAPEDAVVDTFIDLLNVFANGLKNLERLKKVNEMANNVWEQFDKEIDLEGLQKDIKDSEENNGQGNYKEVPHGNYEVAITKLELAASKKGDPMVKVWFKILTGEYKNSLLFMNQVINQGFQVHIVNDFLKSLDSSIEPIQFESYSQYGSMLIDVFEDINGHLEYALEYGENKGFNTFKITEVFEVE